MFSKIGLKGFITLFMLVALSCLTGCWSVHQMKCDKTPYLISEGGTTKRVYALEVTEYLSILPWSSPFDGGAPIILSDSSQPSKMGLHARIRDMPHWRFITNISILAYAMGPPYPDYSQVQNPTAPIRWIISTNPLVVAIGRDEVKVRDWLFNSFRDNGLEMSETFAFVGEDDLGRMTAELVVLDQWPKTWPNSDEVQILGAYAKEHERMVKLGRPTTLREVMNTRLWEKTP